MSAISACYRTGHLEMAQQEGRQLQALVEEAPADLLEKRDNTRPRAHVMAAYQGSHEKYAALYQKLAR